MKNIYTSVLSMLFIINMQAQISIKEIEKLPLINDPLKSVKAGGDTIFYEDFGDGIPSGWSVIDNTIFGTNWIWTTEAPTGQYTWQPAIASTTGENGFMMINGDAYNTPTPDPLYIMDAYFMTNAIDCSAHEFVSLKFQHSYRTDGVISVSVSTDGTNWTEYVLNYYPLEYGISDNPVYETINISDLAGNQPTVYLKFHQYNTPRYYWMVDDIALVEGYVNEMEACDLYANWHYSYNGGHFFITPLNQIQTIYFNLLACNFSNSVAEDVYFHLAITNPTDTVHHETILNEDLNIWDCDTAHTSGEFEFLPPYETAEYFAHLSVDLGFPDEAPGNNSDSIDFSVSEQLYARDHFYNTTTGPDDIYGFSDGDFIGNSFYFVNKDTIKSILVYIDETSGIGSTITGKIYYYNSNYYLITTSDPYTITSDDLGTWVEIQVGTVVPEPTGSCHIYFAGVSINGNNLIIGADESDIHLYNVENRVNMGGDWYYDDKIPMIRIKLGIPSISTIQENISNSIINVFPNPADESIKVLISESAVYKIYDIKGTGCLYGSISPESCSVDVSSLEGGIYFIEVIGRSGNLLGKFIKK